MRDSTSISLVIGRACRPQAFGKLSTARADSWSFVSDRTGRLRSPPRRPSPPRSLRQITTGRVSSRHCCSPARSSFRPPRLPRPPAKRRTANRTMAGSGPFHVAGYRFIAGENLTPRMPEGVIAPLLAWSLKYVTLFAPDILATRNELIRLEERQTALAVETRLSRRTNVALADAPGSRHISMIADVRAAACLSGRPRTMAFCVRTPGRASSRRQSTGCSCISTLASTPASRRGASSAFDRRARPRRRRDQRDRHRDGRHGYADLHRTPILVSRGGRASTPRRCSTKSACSRPRATSFAPISLACATARSRRCGPAACR